MVGIEVGSAIATVAEGERGRTVPRLLKTGRPVVEHLFSGYMMPFPCHASGTSIMTASGRVRTPLTTSDSKTLSNAPGSEASGSVTG